MTRGRLENRAYVVCETAGEHHGEPAEPTPTEVLTRALARSSADRAATEVLRGELARAEDLAVLVPALLEARRQIVAGAGPDRRAEVADARLDLQFLEARLGRARAEQAQLDTEIEHARGALEEAHGELGCVEGRLLLRHRREALGQARARVESWSNTLAHDEWRRANAVDLVERVEAECGRARMRVNDLEAAVERWAAWLDAHPTELAYGADLDKRVKRRTSELGVRAAEELPAHIEELLGPAPERGPARERWLVRAAAVEAFREQWRVDPTGLGQQWLRSTQRRHWESVERLLEPVQADRVAHALHPVQDRGLEIDFGP